MLLACRSSIAVASVAGLSESFFMDSEADVDESGLLIKEDSAISPTLQPTSDKKFFGKDYPWDKRPKVDVFHFKHPYPVVQDSGDFDKDYVKDENSDNGAWKAQTEYDRLRHKLAKEKHHVAKALEAKEAAEKELQDATRREKDQLEKMKKMEEKKKEKEKEEAEAEKKVKKQKQGAISGNKGEAKEKEYSRAEKYVVPESKSPGGVVAPGVVKAATDDTQKAMDALDECKKQLAEARAKLEKLLKELEDAKKRQEETQAALDAAIERLRVLEGGQAAVDAKAKKELQEYKDAQRALAKQQAVVAKMEADIKAAAAKVKALRDAEDKSGGVYPTPKSGVAPRSVLPLCMLILFAQFLGLLVH